MWQERITVGIVSALWTESAAMRSLVFGLRRVPPRPHDRNHYLEGWLPSTDLTRPHGVVLALLPQDGTSNASSLCTDLLRSYPALECVVLCGIAGGVPSLTDPSRHVRLGDVVVADSIVGYGHIWRTNGVDVLRRHQGGKSADLTSAANELRAGELTGDHPWRTFLADTDPRMEQFRRPPAGSDVLHVAGVPVPHPDPSKSHHELGWPKIHYGPIGSADVLLRDELARDELAAKHKILAVEMEAYGVASVAVLKNRAWFVVRGIADYCENSGKTDEWHLYSSMAAAAYLRALLAMCHPLGGVPATRDLPEDALHSNDTAPADQTTPLLGGQPMADLGVGLAVPCGEPGPDAQLLRDNR